MPAARLNMTRGRAERRANVEHQKTVRSERSTVQRRLVGGRSVSSAWIQRPPYVRSTDEWGGVTSGRNT
eukprot:15460561-Alexandrium_andersonii.AAC.1